MIKNRKSGL